MNVVEVRDMVKTYGRTRAVNGITFEVRQGEIFGMLGPNGAGKTTTIDCITGLRAPDSGTIRVLDVHDVGPARGKLYQRIGVQLQETSYPEKIRVCEICQLFSAFYSKPLSYEDLLVRFSLHEKRNAYVTELSGGQRQRLSIILALIPNPEIVFFDELTTGLDPHSRRTMWELIKELRNEGRTIFMTTHYMEEAEYLCDRVCIVNQGIIIMLDTVENIIATSGIDTMVSFQARDQDMQDITEVAGVNRVEKTGDTITIYGQHRRLIGNIVSYLERKQADYSNLRLKTPNLEDVFLKYTGKTITG